LQKIIDPSDERIPIKRKLALRPDALSGVIGLVDISKPRGDVFLDQLERRIKASFPRVKTRRYRKPTFTKPASEDLRQKISRECQFVVEAVAD
jgi:hypothetical protein